MHQQTYCHTLPKPFSKIFLFRIYAPTIHSTDFKFGETSVRHPHISAPIQPPQTNPPTTQSTKSPRPYDPQTNPPTTTDAQTKPQIPHSTNTTPIQPPQTHTASTNTHAHSTQARPPTQTLTPLHAKRCHTPTLMQHRCSRSHSHTSPQLDRPGRQDQIEPDKTKLDQKQIRPD